jgi:hypothetical protein
VAGIDYCLRWESVGFFRLDRLADFKKMCRSLLKGKKTLRGGGEEHAGITSEAHADVGAGVFIRVRVCRRWRWDSAVLYRSGAYDPRIQRGAHARVERPGQFEVFSGFIEMDPEARIVNNAEATIKAWSVNTNHHQRDAHLRCPDI